MDYNEELVYSAVFPEVEKYFYSLDKEDIIFKDSDSLYAECKITVTEKFCNQEEDKEAYFAYLTNLFALMLCAQTWYEPKK